MMTEYKAMVEKYSMLIEADEWNKQSTGMHMHSLKSMWYETEETQKHTDNGMVVDYSYPDGHIERFQDGKLIYTVGKKLEGDALLAAYKDKS